MSLLSGIRYVPKSDRKEDDHKSDHKSKHHDKHKHKRKHKSKDKDKDKEKKHKHHHHDSDSDDEKQLDIEADRQMMLELVQSDDDDRHEPEKRMRTNSPDEYSENYRDDYSSHYDDKPVLEPINRAPSSESEAASTNTSVAALLRARLKKGGAASTANPATTISARPSDTPDISFMSAGELKWMSDYTRRAKGGAAPAGGNDEAGDGMSIQQMAAAEKFGSAGTDMDGVIASNIIRKGSNFKGTELGLGSSVSRGGVGVCLLCTFLFVVYA
jgi:hypothetical protein